MRTARVPAPWDRNQHVGVWMPRCISSTAAQPSLPVQAGDDVRNEGNFRASKTLNVQDQGGWQRCWDARATEVKCTILVRSAQGELS